MKFASAGHGQEITGLVSPAAGGSHPGPTEAAGADLPRAPITDPRKEKVYKTKQKELITVFVVEEQPFLISLYGQEIGNTQGSSMDLACCPGDAG